MEIPYVVTPRKDTGLFNSKIAIWLFLASEVMLFGGLFSGYVFLRLGASDPDWGYPWPERTLPVLPGLINTFILIASSVTVVFAWASLKMRKWARFQFFMGITVLCAVVFMGFKAVEYSVKFKHQAARLQDFTMVEGHIDYEKEGGGDDHGHDHAGDHSADYLKDSSGHKIERNHYKVATTALTFQLDRYHKPWVEEFLAEAERAGAAITLADAVDFNLEGKTGEPVFEAGSELSLDLLAEIRKVQLKHRGENAEWRTRFLREAWDMKWADVDGNRLLSEAAFIADFPKGTELEADERDKAYARWKAGQRANMATEVSIESVKLTGGDEPVRIKGQSYSELEQKEIATVTFKVEPALSLRFRSHDVIDAYSPDASDRKLRDGTAVAGEYEDSAMHFHYVDGIDFQHLAMDAERKDQDPMVAIANSWLIQENPEIAKIWEMHQEGVRQLEEELAQKGRVPTEKDRYRMGWQELAYYGTLIHEAGGYENVKVEDVKITPGSATPPREKMHLVENFIGPNYEERHFPHLAIPREQVLLDSKFTPKWNTYYAIYFTITGLHGLHVVGGAIVLAYYLFFSRKMYLSNPEWLANRVEVGGLFWHFVDLVWIFAFPIFYLM